MDDRKSVGRVGVATDTGFLTHKLPCYHYER